MDKIKTVTVVGGTHGNEFTGVYLIKKWREKPVLIKRSSFATSTLVANVPAYEANRRYLECDLNRQFSETNLNVVNPSLLEHKLALQINERLGPKSSPKTDLVIDLHNTTSNMGPSLLLAQQGYFYTQLARYMKSKMPEVTVFRDEDDKSREEHHLLNTVGRYGVLVEVGPIPQSVLKHQITEEMERMVKLILDFVEGFNKQTLDFFDTPVESFRFIESLTLPLNEKGERIGMVHKHIEGNDYHPIEPGAPLFQTFDGQTLYYEGDKTVYPAFINEAAYYDNNLAMSLMEKVLI